MKIRSSSAILALLFVLAPASAGAAPLGAQVTNGTEVTRARYDAVWRATVSLQSTYVGGGGAQLRDHGCGGVLIQPTVVLTAAHCVGRSVTTSTRLYAHGATRRLSRNPKRRFGARARVVETVVHPGHVDGFFGSAGMDLALLKLAEPIPGATTIDVVAPGNDAEWGAGTGRATGAWIAGWGLTRGYSYGDDDYSLRNRDLVAALRAQLDHGPSSSPSTSQFLLEAELPILPDRRCASSDSPMGRGAAEFDRRTMLCVGTADTRPGSESNRTGACFGDSGGPLVVLGADGVPRLVGITSWGRDYGCGGLSVYARVPAARAWIERTIASMAEPAPTTFPAGVSGTMVDEDTLRLTWPAVQGGYERVSVVEERSLLAEYLASPWQPAERIPPALRRLLARTVTRSLVGFTGEGSTSLRVDGVTPRRAGANVATYRLVASLDSGRLVYGPRARVALPIDARPPTPPGLPRRIGTFQQSVGLMRWRTSTDDDCVAAYALEVRWPAWKPGVWSTHHLEATRCGGGSPEDTWYELPANRTPLYDLRRGTWLMRAVAIDHAGNRGVGPVARVRVPQYVEDLGLEPECRIAGPNVVCTYPKDEY